MKKIIVVFLVTLAYSCGMKPKQHGIFIPISNYTKDDTTNHSGGKVYGVKIDTPNYFCIDDFNEFRKAICRGNLAKVEKWFTFPIPNPRVLWFLISFNGGSKTMVNNDGLPFTKKDFWKFFNDIFPDGFIKSIVAINADELLANGETRAPDFTYIKKSDKVTYKVFAKTISEDTTLNLSFIRSTAHLTQDGIYYKKHHEGMGIIYVLLH